MVKNDIGVRFFAIRIFSGFKMSFLHHHSHWETLTRYPVFEVMVPLPRSMANSLLALPRSCHDLGKGTMAMQDRAKANHD